VAASRPPRRARPDRTLRQTAQVTSSEPEDRLAGPLAAAHAQLVHGAAQVLPAGGLATKLLDAEREGRPLRVKLGIDPSGSELTIGHAVVLRKLRRFQDHGHVAVLIVGDFTGMVGDPSGRSATRTLLSAEETAANSASYFAQVMRILDPDRVEVRRNSEWLATLTMADVIRESAHLTVARLLERDDFAKRFSARQPISLVEFLYPLLQGFDSVAVRADVELGGTDQTYNLLVGRDLQRAHGQAQQVVLTMPLLEGLDGVQKMGKSLNNYVSISEAAAEQFGKLMSVPDDLVARYAALATDLSPAEVEALDKAVRAGGPAAGRAKRTMARAVVSLYHGAAAARAAEERFDTVFAGRAVPDDLPEHPLPESDPVHLPGLLRDLGFAPSTSQGRRLIDDGAVRIDQRRLATGEYDLPRKDLAGRVLAAGRRRLVRLGK
jgi:tyrosyl-tRNA synthetase